MSILDSLPEAPKDSKQVVSRVESPSDGDIKYLSKLILPCSAKCEIKTESTLMLRLIKTLYHTIPN